MNDQPTEVLTAFRPTWLCDGCGAALVCSSWAGFLTEAIAAGWTVPQPNSDSEAILCAECTDAAVMLNSVIGPVPEPGRRDLATMHRDIGGEAGSGS